MSEPTVDEEKFKAMQRVIRLAALRPTAVEGDSCANYLYYLEPEEGFAFCWQEKLQILVDAEWWCHYWEMTEWVALRTDS